MYLLSMDIFPQMSRIDLLYFKGQDISRKLCQSKEEKLRNQIRFTHDLPGTLHAQTDQHLEHSKCFQYIPLYITFITKIFFIWTSEMKSSVSKYFFSISRTGFENVHWDHLFDGNLDVKNRKKLRPKSLVSTKLQHKGGEDVFIF